MSARVRIVRPRELGPAEIARWRELQARSPHTGSAYHTPEWALLVDAVRSDVRVAVIESASGIDGFFGVQSSRLGTAMPMGAPMCDHQAVIACPDQEIDWNSVLRALHVDRFDFSAVPYEQAQFLAHRRGAPVESWVCDLRGGYGAYAARRKAEGSDSLRKIDQKWRKTEREIGPIRVERDVRDPALFAHMIALKRNQCRSTGVIDPFDRRWTRELVQSSFEQPATPNFAGRFAVMYIGDQAVAFNYRLRSGPIEHAWYIAHEAAFERASPGLLLTRDLLEAGAHDGVEEVDFGPGDYQYKLTLRTGSRRVAQGFISRPGLRSFGRELTWNLRQWFETCGPEKLRELPAKAMRRLDVWRGLGMFQPR